jgi:hypothetical protein
MFFLAQLQLLHEYKNVTSTKTRFNSEEAKKFQGGQQMTNLRRPAINMTLQIMKDCQKDGQSQPSKQDVPRRDKQTSSKDIWSVDF